MFMSGYFSINLFMPRDVYMCPTIISSDQYFSPLSYQAITLINTSS